MKKILYILIITGCAALLSVSCSKDMLDTAPAGSLSGAEIFGDAGKAQSAVDGIYRLMYTNGWSVNWSPEHPGLAGFTLVRSLMGEDHFQYSQGNGWFYFDYSFGVASDWTHTSGRQYGTWNMFYTFISQANYILDNEEAVKDDAEWQNVLGQAYAIRAYSYYCLYESFCQGNYTENKDKPGVPVYTKGTNKETEGVGGVRSKGSSRRSTVISSVRWIIWLRPECRRRTARTSTSTRPTDCGPGLRWGSRTIRRLRPVPKTP